MSAKRHQFSGSTIEEALEAATAELGRDITVLRARRVTSRRALGLGSRVRYEVDVSVGDGGAALDARAGGLGVDASAPTSGAGAAGARSAAGGGEFDGVLADLIDNIERLEATPNRAAGTVAGASAGSPEAGSRVRYGFGAADFANATPTAYGPARRQRPADRGERTGSATRLETRRAEPKAPPVDLRQREEAPLSGLAHVSDDVLEALAESPLPARPQPRPSASPSTLRRPSAPSAPASVDGSRADTTPRSASLARATVSRQPAVPAGARRSGSSTRLDAEPDALAELRAEIAVRDTVAQPSVVAGAPAPMVASGRSAVATMRPPSPMPVGGDEVGFAPDAGSERMHDADRLVVGGIGPVVVPAAVTASAASAARSLTAAAGIGVAPTESLPVRRVARRASLEVDPAGSAAGAPASWVDAPPSSDAAAAGGVSPHAEMSPRSETSPYGEMPPSGGTVRRRSIAEIEADLARLGSEALVAPLVDAEPVDPEEFASHTAPVTAELPVIDQPADRWEDLDDMVSSASPTSTPDAPRSAGGGDDSPLARFRARMRVKDLQRTIERHTAALDELAPMQLRLARADTSAPTDATLPAETTASATATSAPSATSAAMANATTTASTVATVADREVSPPTLLHSGVAEQRDPATSTALVPTETALDLRSDGGEDVAVRWDSTVPARKRSAGLLGAMPSNRPVRDQTLSLEHFQPVLDPAATGEPRWSIANLERIGLPTVALDALAELELSCDADWMSAMELFIRENIAPPVARPAETTGVFISGTGRESAVAIVQAGLLGFRPGYIFIDGKLHLASSIELMLAIRACLPR